jgi:hypothetical protein
VATPPPSTSGSATSIAWSTWPAPASARRAGAVGDEEDAALSAFDSFCRAATQGRFPELADRGGLWRLLVVITLRKVTNQIDHQRAQKRGGGRLTGEEGLGGLDLVVGDGPSPELAAMVADEYRQLRSALRDNTLRQILDLRREGCTREEIAGQLGITERAVRRKLAVIRDMWLGEASS